MNSLLIVMTTQGFAGMISLIGALLVTAVVIFLLRNSSQDEDGDTSKAKVYKVRGQYFWGLCAAIIVALFTSLRLLPYPVPNDQADETITVMGMQWAWQMAPGEETIDPAEFRGVNEIDLPVGKNIKFVVTSKDVNHGFGIYNSRGELLTQTQAMPGYNNELYYSFNQKGDYLILCMEYCGMAHAMMKATLHVQ